MNRKDTIWKKRIHSKRIRQVALVLVLALSLGESGWVSASTIQNANEKKQEAQNELNATQEKIDRIEQQQSQLQSEINALDAELVDVILNLDILADELVRKEDELDQVKEDLAQAEEDEKKQYQAMKKRIRFMYERGDTAFLTAILESKSIAELLNRVEYYNEIYDYDRELLVAYQTVKLQVADLKLQVESEIAELEGLQITYQEEQGRYETLIAQKQGEMADFDVQLASAQELAAKYKNTINEQNNIIRQEEERIAKEEAERRRREEEAKREEEAQRQEENNKKPADSGSQNPGNKPQQPSEEEDKVDTGKDPAYSTNVSGSEVVNFACSFIGNPYVYGGTDINNGIDCSAFVRYVFANFGISLPRDSYSQRYAGKEVSYANAKPGDIICYSGHVAIYMGNGQIVHASNSAPYPAGGIKTSSATYRTIVSVRRVL